MKTSSHIIRYLMYQRSIFARWFATGASSWKPVEEMFYYTAKIGPICQICAFSFILWLPLKEQCLGHVAVMSRVIFKLKIAVIFGLSPSRFRVELIRKFG